MTPEHPLSPDAKVPEVVTWLRAEAMRHAGRRGTKTATDALGIAASVLENAAGVSGPLDDEDDGNDVVRGERPMTPADELRQAATTLRRVSYVDFAIRVGEADYDAIGLNGVDLEPLAAWLEHMAEHGATYEAMTLSALHGYALDLARRINGVTR